MRVVIQRVLKANVKIHQQEKAKIGKGFLLFAGFEEPDTAEDVDWMINKVVQLRIFDDENGVMNRSLLDEDAEMLLISQFTLHASTKKGNRPSYQKAAPAMQAEKLYEYMIAQLELSLGKAIGTGIFGANMQVSLINNGPVTIIIDSKNKE